jgi:hypothetical protein
MSEVRKIGEGMCRAHNPDKQEYEVFETADGFYCETHHTIGGPYAQTDLFATREEAEADYRRRVMISGSWKDGEWIGDPKEESLKEVYVPF